MHAIVRGGSHLVRPMAAYLLALSTAASAQEPERRQLPAPTDVDSRLTEVMRRLERELADAIIHKDSAGLERLLGPDYTLRIADVPQGSLPRVNWMDNTLHRLKADSFALQHVAARTLTENVAVVALTFHQQGSMEGRDMSGEFYIVDLWKQSSGGWQLAARYSSPVGKRVDRESRVPPPPADIDPPLTDTLGRLERRLGDLALHGYKDTLEMKRLVGSDFAVRFSDAPERSVPRALWGQPTSRYRIEALDQRFHAARRLADDLAVVSLLLIQQASFDGRDRSGEFYVVDIWSRRSDRWQLVARYSSPQGKTLDRTPPR